MAYDYDDDDVTPATLPPAVEGTILLSRILVGMYFLLAGVAKVKGEFANGLGAFYTHGFKPLQPWFLPDFVAVPMGYLLPWLEIIFGLLFVIGLLTRASAVVLSLMLISFTMALIMANNSVAGGGPGPFHSNILLACICLIVLAAGPGKMSIDALCPHRRGDLDTAS